MLQGLLRGVTIAGASATDPFFSSVVLLMGFEGADGSTGAPGMTDESPAAHGTASRNGSTVAIKTAQQKFGSSSLFVGGSGPQDLIYFADSNDWNLAAGSFTIECSIDPVSFGTSSGYLFNQWGQLGSHGWILFVETTAQLAWAVSTTGSNTLIDMTSGAGTLTTGAWYQVCVDYDGVKYRMYINGVMLASFATPRTIFDSPYDLSIGGDFNSLLNFYNGYMDEVRITKGVARYASDSGYTPATARFPRS